MQNKTAIDWLRFRSRAETPMEVVEALKPLFGAEASMLNVVGLKHGFNGFQQSLQVRIADMPVARLDFGGDSQRGWIMVDIPGKGCQWVRDWDAIEVVEQLPRAEIKRCDVALTTWHGEIGHNDVVAAHTAGRFVTRGRPPNMRVITSTNDRAGKTCEIGTRKGSDKFVRAYEKGFELAAKMPGIVETIDGCAIEDIYRVEVEFKANSSIIPWSVIDRSDVYFAGAYPYCNDVLPGIESDVFMRRPEREPQLGLKAALANIRQMWGKTLFTACAAHGGDFGAVWMQVVGSEHSKALLEQGVLLVEH